MAYEGVPPEVNTARSSRMPSATTTTPATDRAPEPNIPCTGEVTIIDVDGGNVVKKRVVVDGHNTLA